MFASGTNSRSVRCRWCWRMEGSMIWRGPEKGVMVSCDILDSLTVRIHLVGFCNELLMGEVSF